MISSEKIVQNIAKNASYCMRQRGDSLRALATSVELPKTSVFNLVQGKNEARISVVARVANHYGVTIEQIMMSPIEFQKLWRPIKRQKFAAG